MEQENPIRPACVAEQLAILQGYFPQLSEKQTEQFQALYDLYAQYSDMKADFACKASTD